MNNAQIYLFNLKQQDVFKICSKNRQLKVDYVYVLYNGEKGDPEQEILSDKLYTDSIFIIQNFYFYISKYLYWIVNLYNVLSTKKITSMKAIQLENKSCFTQVASEVIKFNKNKLGFVGDHLLLAFSFKKQDLKLFD